VSGLVNNALAVLAAVGDRELETGLVTECALTAATAPDGPTGVELLGDTHYGSGATRAALRAAGHVQTIKPIPLSSSVPGGFTIHDFHIDQQAGTARCPAGQTAPITSSGHASFARWCRSCPLRGRCATAKQARTVQSTRTRTSCAPPAGAPPRAAVLGCIPVRLGSRLVHSWTLKRQLVCIAIVVLGGMR
jgi:hypothetical protein